MDNFSHVLPPGFRFHPSDEQLVDYYLRKKIASKGIDLDIIKDVDLYKIEPWDLEELCKTVGSTDNQNEWYFFSHKDKKYPTGTRTNRATKAGFWKATGRDKAIYRRNMLVGMRKTLVFYEGRAPSGQKSDWIMHEYRLETNENGTTQEEGWVVCRVFKKRLTTVRKMGDYESPGWYDQVSFMPEIDNSPRRPSISHHPNHVASPYNHHHHHQQQHQQHYSQCKQELDLRQYNINMIPHHHLDSFLQLPQLESPRLPHQSDPSYGSNCVLNNQPNLFNSSSSSSAALYCNNNDQQGVDQVTDWRVLDKFVASQLSHDDGVPKEVGTNYSNNNAASSLFHVGEHMNMFANEAARRAENDVGQDYASTSTSSCQIDLWK